METSPASPPRLTQFNGFCNTMRREQLIMLQHLMLAQLSNNLVSMNRDAVSVMTFQQFMSRKVHGCKCYNNLFIINIRVCLLCWRLHFLLTI